MKAKSILLLVAIAASFMMNSCNTFRGLGQDLQRTGQGLNNVSYGQPF